MNQKVETSSRFDVLKWIIVVALVAAGVIGNQYYSEQLLVYRVLALLAGGMVALLIAAQTAQGAAFWNLLKESLVEVRRVVWPSIQETHQTTLIVLVVVVIMMIILWALDSILGWVARAILG
jgi:preprotein translocase subunit SecE